MNELENKLINIIYECNQHKKRIVSAYQKMKNSLPLTIESYTNFEEDKIEHIDQFLFRFSRLQDTMGEKLFPTVLILLGENITHKPFIDILNNLEKLELIFKDDWMELRQIRNGVAHEYSFNMEELVDSLNVIYVSYARLIAVYDGIYQYCMVKFSFLNSNPVLLQLKNIHFSAK